MMILQQKPVSLRQSAGSTGYGGHFKNGRFEKIENSIASKP